MRSRPLTEAAMELLRYLFTASRSRSFWSLSISLLASTINSWPTRVKYLPSLALRLAALANFVIEPASVTCACCEAEPA